MLKGKRDVYVEAIVAAPTERRNKSFKVVLQLVTKKVHNSFTTALHQTSLFPFKLSRKL